MSKDPVVKKKCLTELRELWELICICESTAQEDSWAMDFMKHLVFPERTFEREILIMLAEEFFGSVSPEIENLIIGFSDAWHSTNIDEDMMIKYRTREAAQSAGECSRLSRWHVAAATNLMQDYDRKVVAELLLAMSML